MTTFLVGDLKAGSELGYHKDMHDSVHLFWTSISDPLTNFDANAVIKESISKLC